MIPTWSSKFELKPNTWVFVPTADATLAGQAIKLAIEKKWRPPSNYFHLRAGGHVKALQIHLENSYFSRLDIQDFFGSINKSRVTRCLKGPGLFNYADAREMANVSTVIHPVRGKLILPFGFVQSPVIASLCLFKSALGQCLRKLPKKFGITVSVYVDDIILSSNDEQVLQKTMIEVNSRAERSGFPLNAKKCDGPGSQITAFNIELSHLSMSIEPARWAQFVTAFNESKNSSERGGIHSYINSVNPSQAAKLGPI